MSNPITIHNPLGPAVVRTIREAFDDALVALTERRGPNAPPPSDDTCALLAKQIVGLAKRGECDFTRLRDGALTALHFGS